MDKIITETREDAVALRWLQKATAGADRPILSGMHIEEDRAVTADGFRIHQIMPPPGALEPFVNGSDPVIRMRDGKALHKTPGRVYDVEEIEGNYPDVDSVEPSLYDRPRAIVALNARYLREALEMPTNEAYDRAVLITVYGPTQPVTIESWPRPSAARALVMPMEPGWKEGAGLVAEQDAAYRAKQEMDWVEEHYPEIAAKARRQAKKSDD